MEAIQILIIIAMLVISGQILIIWFTNEKLESNLKNLEKWLTEEEGLRDAVTVYELDQGDDPEEENQEGDMSSPAEESAYNTYLTIEELREYFWNKRN